MKIVCLYVELSDDDAFLSFADALTSDEDDVLVAVERAITERLGRSYPQVSVTANVERLRERAIDVRAERFRDSLDKW